ncbi:MAG: hypothetical protein Roseis2KO_54160 [Roseivirga sp.]
MSFEIIVYQLFRVCGIAVSKSYLTERVKAHPDYPSLASLTDLLDEWELDYSALQLEPSDLAQMEYPFLAHVVTAEGMEDFEIIRDAEQLEKEQEHFLQTWTGIVVWLASGQTIASEEHDRELRSERLNRRARWSVGVLSLATLGFVLSQAFSWFSLGFALTSLAGIIISGAIVGYAMGMENSISKSFCKVGASGCQKIINSSFSRLLPQLHLSDLGLIYFIGMLLIQFFVAGNSQQVLSSLFIIPSTLAVLATLITLSYQALKGDWCRLCLLLTLVIWVQAALLFSTNSWPLSLGIDIPILAQSLLAMIFPAAWILIKPFMTDRQKLEAQSIKVRKWRQNPAWFHALLPLHKAVDRTLWSKEIFYGNPEGVLQITLATGPYCEPCSIAHAQVEHIYARYPNDIGVRIRFVIKESKPKDKDATMAILNAYEKLLWQNGSSAEYIQNPLSEQIIKDWFIHQDLKAFNKLYPPADGDSPGMLSLLRQHIHWGQQFQIDQTPGFFVNGFEMPNPHTLADLNIFLDSYIEQLKPSPQFFEIPDQSNQSLS